MTPLELVTKAARRVNIIAHNETLTESEAQDALENLNGIVSNWSMRPLIARSGLSFPVAITDAHTGMSAVEEDRFAGKGQKDSRPELRKNPTGLGSAKGWDMGAALAMANALGVDSLIAAELLPEVEAVMVRKLNEQIGEGHG